MLYRVALGAAFADLDPMLQRVHDGAAPQRLVGRARLEHGSAHARLAARLAGYPATAGEMPLRVSIAPQGEAEVWTRHFGNHPVQSVQRPAGPGLIAETLGPVTLILRPEVRGGALHCPVVGLRGLGLPLPASLLRAAGGVETPLSAGRFAFDVGATALGLGRIIRYHGWLAPED